MNKTRWAGVAMIGVILIVATGCPPFSIGLPLPPPPTVWPIVAVGSHHSCAQNGRIYCWGDNSAGQLGNGTTTSSSTPVEVTGVTWATGLSAGGDRTCVIHGVDNNVLCWGDNSTGGLGDGTTMNRSTATEVVGLIDMQSVSVGDTFTCATHSAGGVVCWGQVPGVPGGFTTTPVPIAGLETATGVTVGARHVCAVVGTTLECFGDNSAGQLGDGTTTSSATPVAVSGAFNLDPTMWASGGNATAGGDHTCAVSYTSSSYWCWGDNSSGQLGDGTTTNRSTPTAVPFPALGYPLSGSYLALGDGFSCIVFQEKSTDTTPVVSPHFGCWGDNSSGQLGDGTTTSRASYAPGSITVQPGQVVASGDHACGVQYATTSSKPKVRCWGGNAFGQVGNGSTTSSPTPVEVVGAYSKDPPALKPANPLPVVTFTASPKIVVAGQPVTFTLHITHPVGLISVSTEIEVIQSATLPHIWGCDDEHAVWTGTDTDRTITFSCTMPADSPVWITQVGQPSLWAFSVNIRGVDSPKYSHWFPFYLNGTSTDTSGPTQISTSVTPNPVALGQSFVVSAQYLEPHGPISVSQPVSYSDSATCGPPVIDASAAPVYGVTATCVAHQSTIPYADPTTQVSLDATVTDAFGFHSYTGWGADVATP